MNHQINLQRLEKVRQKPEAESFNLKNFIKIAYEKLNPDLSTVEGLKQFLVTWYCFQYGVTEKDDKLLDMTIEELVVLYQMHRIKEDPKYYEEVTQPENSFEEWLKKEMGDSYVTEEENIQQIVQEEKDYTKKIRDQFPEEVTTDFSQFQNDGDN